jgi:glycosyltransferase involved in cell wall biosynthesis
MKCSGPTRGCSSEACTRNGAGEFRLLTRRHGWFPFRDGPTDERTRSPRRTAASRRARAATHPRARLLIVGGAGSELERVTALAKASPFAERIHLAGHQSEPQPFYQAMDLLVVPSNNEGLSNAMLEAMACGSADVITAGVDRLVANIESADGFAEMLGHAFLSTAKLEELGRFAREKVVRQFSLATMAAIYANGYRSMAPLRARRNAVSSGGE